MLLKPKQVWWATESWKYRNPEANELSEAATGCPHSAASGSFLGAIMLASLAWSTASDQKAADEKQRQQDRVG
jgi:hypothetical protein